LRFYFQWQYRSKDWEVSQYHLQMVWSEINPNAPPCWSQVPLWREAHIEQQCGPRLHQLHWIQHGAVCFTSRHCWWLWQYGSFWATESGRSSSYCFSGYKFVQEHHHHCKEFLWLRQMWWSGKVEMDARGQEIDGRYGSDWVCIK